MDDPLDDSTNRDFRPMFVYAPCLVEYLRRCKGTFADH